MPLEREMEYYGSIKDELLQHHQGKYVLIIGDENFGIFDNIEDAYKRGLELRGNVPMLIQKVEKEDKIEAVPAMVLGLMDAYI